MCESLFMADAKKDSTNELPMYDIEEALKLVTTIHEQALETAAMPDVAKGCGYANPTSTPFYRRMLAARLFRLLSAPKPELTKNALDYLKPDTDDAKQKALNDALMGIPAYADLIQKHVGKRVNTELVGNSLAKSHGLTDSCAMVCARMFASSLKFAGFFSNDGTVVIPLTAGIPVANAPAGNGLVEPPKIKNKQEEPPDDERLTHTLYLDSRRKRKITIQAPFSVTKDELERIRAWLGFQLLIENGEAPPNQP